MKNNFQIAPSLLSANFLNLEKELRKCKDNKIEWIHYDVMDYDFVPNLTFGSKILQDITKVYNFKIDIHFMVKIKTKNVLDFLSEYIKAKPNMFTMHVEALTSEQINEFISICENYNIKKSLALSPNIDIEQISQYLPRLDNILIMSVHPGFGGQKFISDVLIKADHLYAIAQKNKYDYTIEIDGGVNEDTINQVKEHPFNIAVAGSYLFEAEDFTYNLNKIR